MDATNLKEALERLDPEDNEHWTALGLPRLEVLGEDVKRKDVEEVAPEFNRVVARAAAMAKQAENAAESDTVDAEAAQDQDEGAENEPPVVPEDEFQASDDEDEPQDEPEPEKPVETVAEVVAQDEVDKEELRAELTAELAELNAARAGASAAKEEATRAIDLLDKRIAKLQERFDGEVGPIPLSTALRDFIDSSHRERMARAGRILAINKAVGVKTNLTAQAPIDAAYAHKRGRGKGRPKHPVLKR